LQFYLREREREGGERISMPELCPETNGEKEREVEEKAPLV